MSAVRGYKPPLKPSLWAQLQEQPYRFSFHQAIHLCAAVYGETKLTSPSATPYQIKSHVYLAYPPSDVQALTLPKTPEEPVRLVSNILGLAGVQGPLPLPFTEDILARARAKDFGLQDFLDLFNHRLSLLYHHGVQKHQLAHYQGPPEKHPYGMLLQSLMGEKAPEGCLYYTSLFWHKPRSWKGLEVLLSSAFHRVVHILPYQGHWMPLAPQHRMKLNRGCTLGGTWALGTRVWQQTRGFAVRLAAQSLEDFFEFLPSRSKYCALRALIRRYIGVEMRVTVLLDWGQIQPQGIRLNQSFFLNWSSALASASPSSQRHTRLEMVTL